MALQQDAQSWLPTEFLTQEDSVSTVKDSNFNTTELQAESSKLSSCFPTEFPYEFDSFGSGSSVSSLEESFLGSFETELTERDEFFAGLTRRLSQQLSVKPEKKWVMAGSPESTLSGLGSWSASSNGSPNGVLSPPTTPFGAKNDIWDLIHEAAEEIARLKMNNEMNNPNLQERSYLGPAMTQNSVSQLRNHSSGLYSSHSNGHDIPCHRQYYHKIKQDQLTPHQYSSVWGRQQVKMGSHAQAQPHSHLQNQQLQGLVKGRSHGYENGRCARPVGAPHSAWSGPQMQPSYQHNQSQQSSGSGMRAVFLGGSGARRECAGTGVFLPRRYANLYPPSEPKKKTTCSTVLLPAKVVHALNLNFEEMNPNSHVQPRFNTGFSSDYDMLMARRNAMVDQQRRNMRAENVLNHELLLPQEWTY